MSQDHFVIEITVKSVRKPVITPGTRYKEESNAIDGQGRNRIIEDVVRVVAKGDTLTAAIAKAKAHLAVEEEHQNATEG